MLIWDSLDSILAVTSNSLTSIVSDSSMNTSGWWEDHKIQQRTSLLSLILMVSFFPHCIFCVGVASSCRVLLTCICMKIVM